MTEHRVRNEVANNKEAEKHGPFHHADPNAMLRVELVEDPSTGSTHATGDLKSNFHIDVAANGDPDPISAGTAGEAAL